MATAATGLRHRSTAVDQGFEIRMDFVTSRGRIEPVHKVVKVTLVPGIFEGPSATDRGVQILVLSNVHVLVGGQVHHCQLSVINEQAGNREQYEGHFNSRHQNQPWKRPVLGFITCNVCYQRYDEEH